MSLDLNRRQLLAMLSADAFSRKPLIAQAGDLSLNSAITPSARILASGPGEAFLAVATVRDLTTMTVDGAIQWVYVVGYYSAGRGGAWYRRAAGEPIHAGKIKSADGQWWEISTELGVDVCQFGAQGDGTADDTAAIQAAIDYSIYTEAAPKTVLFPSGTYKTTDTIQVGYGERYITVELVGQLDFHGFLPMFSDRPCINVQAGRNVRLKKLTLSGTNRSYLRDHYDRFRDRTDISLWYGPTISPQNNSRYAPYAGITIDGYAGVMPTPHYPEVNYPAFIKSNGQYQKGFSSNTIIDDCHIEGFCVGVAVQPCMVPDDSNGDFITYRDCDISFNIVGIADGHADARCSNIYNSHLHFNYTAVDAVSYGPKHGTFISHISGSSFDNNVNILNVNIGGSQLQGGYPIKFDACYGESVYRIGNIYTSGRQISGIGFESCKFYFSVRNEEYSPIDLVSGGISNLIFKNCVIQGDYGFYNFDAAIEMDGVAFASLIADGFGTNGIAGRIAKSFTGGLWAGEARRVRITPHDYFSYSGRSLIASSLKVIDSESFPINADADTAIGDQQGVPIPWWTNFLANGRSKFLVSGVPVLKLDRSVYPLSNISKFGCEYSFVVQLGFIADAFGINRDLSYAIGKGDIVVDRSTGRIFCITDADFSGGTSNGTAKLRIQQLNDIRIQVGDRTWEARGDLADKSGVLEIYNARRFYPAYFRVRMFTTKGSNVLGLEPLDGKTNEPRELVIRKGDHVLSSINAATPTDGVFPVGTVVNLDSEKYRVELDSKARYDYSGDTCLFVKGSL
jgi:hypothetical protein